MSISDKLIFLFTVAGVVIFHFPFQNNGEISFNQLNLKEAFRGATINKRIKSYVTDSYYSLANKAIENVALSLINKQKTRLREKEPIVFGFSRKFNVSEAQFTAQGTIKNVTLLDGSQFAVVNLTSYKQENELDVEIFFEKFTANDLNYDVKGKILTTIPVTGRGKINTKTYNVTVTGKIKYDFINYTLKISKMQLHYNFSKFELTITGLKVPLLSQTALNNFLSKEVTNYLRKNEKKICVEASRNITRKINTYLKNFSIFDFIKNWWDTRTPSKKQSLIHSTDLAESNS